MEPDQFSSWDDFFGTLRSQFERILADPELAAEFQADRLGLMIRQTGIGVIRLTADETEETGGLYL